MGDDAASLKAQDEVLEVLYWMRGERLAADASAADLGRLVVLPPEALEAALRRLVGHGLLLASPGAAGEERYRLSEAGAREGGRRFADTFRELTRPGHGECGDPDCECKRTGDPDDCQHRAAN